MSQMLEQDTEAVRQAAFDYIDAFYDTDYSLFEHSVWQGFNKVGFAWRDQLNKYSEPLVMSAERARELIDEWSVKHSKPDDAPREVHVLDVNDQTGIAKVEAFWGFDYLQLGKIDGKWMIVNILWQSHPAKSE